MSEFEAYYRARSNTWEAMWEKVRELDLSQTNDWINAVTPLKNMTIDFRGVHVVDVDVHEALKNWRRDLEMKMVNQAIPLDVDLVRYPEQTMRGEC